MTVLRCVGIEAEHELPFASMHQLVPALPRARRPPARPPGRRAARRAGPELRRVQDRFLVSAGLLSLLAAACEERPVLCCVDDAQWLDPRRRRRSSSRRGASRPSRSRCCGPRATATRAASRRRGSRSSRSPDSTRQHAHALLSARVERPVAPDVAARLLETAHGNPLALLELPSALSAAQLDGVEPIVGPPPVRGAVEAAFGARVGELPDAARRLLLLAAADDVGRPGHRPASPPRRWGSTSPTSTRPSAEGSCTSTAASASATRSCAPPSTAPRRAASAARPTRRSRRRSTTRPAARGIAPWWPTAPDEALAGELEARGDAGRRPRRPGDRGGRLRARRRPLRGRRGAGPAPARPPPRRRSTRDAWTLRWRSPSVQVPSSRIPATRRTSISSAPRRPGAGARPPLAP